MTENKGNKKRKLVSLSIDSKLYKILHKTIDSIVYDCRFQFTKTGLVVTVVDGNNVAIYSTKVQKNVFNEYDLKENCEVGWDFDVIASKGVMKAYNTGTVCIDIFEVVGVKDEVGYLCELRHDIFKDVILLPSTNTIRAIPKIPSLEPECIFNVSVKMLRKIADRSECITVVFENGGVSFNGDMLPFTALGRIADALETIASKNEV